MSLVEQSNYRLPVPPDVEPSMWRVLTEVVFPSARSSQSIKLAIDYCRARGLDILKRPINIVPVWSSEQGREVETIWPSIGEAQITAARSHEWAGLDAPRFGESIEQEFTGRRKGRGGWEDTNVKVTYPLWCEVTVYRLVGGQRHPFTERTYWLEAYGRQGGGIVPNMMWAKRPFGQVAKVAKAASLRAAFPEETGANPTDEEVAGHTIEDVHAVQYEQPHRTLQPITTPPSPTPSTAPLSPPPSSPPSSPPPTSATTPPPSSQPTPSPTLPTSPTTPPTPPHDPTTGEIIEPGALPLGEGETWQQWGQRFIAQVRMQGDLAAVEELTTVNATLLNGMKADLPKMHAGLERSINQHKLSLLPKDDVGPLN